MTDKDAVLKWWAKHIVCAQSTVNDFTTNILPQVECNVLLDEFPTVIETTKVIRLLSSGNVPGSKMKPTEIYEAGGQLMAKKHTELLQCM